MDNDLIRRSDVLAALKGVIARTGLYGVSIETIVGNIPAVDAVELPVKPGADLWWVDEETDDLEVRCEEGGVKAVAVFEDGHYEIVSESGLEKITDVYAWLTRELAEQYRAELLEE